jgi:hypothetical protein
MCFVVDVPQFLSALPDEERSKIGTDVVVRALSDAFRAVDDAVLKVRGGEGAPARWLCTPAWPVCLCLCVCVCHVLGGTLESTVW